MKGGVTRRRWRRRVRQCIRASSPMDGLICDLSFLAPTADSIRHARYLVHNMVTAALSTQSRSTLPAPAPAL